MTNVNIKIDGGTLDTLVESGNLVQCAGCGLYMSEGVTDFYESSAHSSGESGLIECTDCHDAALGRIRDAGQESHPFEQAFHPDLGYTRYCKHCQRTEDTHG